MKIYETIDHGGYSVVYRCIHNDIERAVKIVDLKTRSNGKLITAAEERLHISELMAIQILQKYPHKNIIDFIDIKHNHAIRDGLWHMGPTSEIVMELGEYTLTEIINQNQGDIYFLNPIAEGVVLGIRHLHMHNIIHRDIKHDNVVLVKGVPKIIDLGFAFLSSKEGDWKALTTTCGSRCNMSPEVIKGCYNGKISDCWSLGVLLYNIFTNAHPFDSDDVKTLAKNIIRCRVNPCKNFDALSKSHKEDILSFLNLTPVMRATADDDLSFFCHDSRKNAL